MLELDQAMRHSSRPSTFAFPDICRCVLTPRSFSFVAANAPAHVVNSFELKRQRLASVSLRLASASFIRQLCSARDRAFHSFPVQFVESSVSTVKNTLLLAACTLGRMGLGMLSLLRRGIPQDLHLWASANILNNVGYLLRDRRLQYETNEEGAGEAEIVVGQRSLDRLRPLDFDQNAVAADILRALTVSLPTDLSRLIFLATLRDNNSGHYHHPEVARRFSDSLADQAMLACHQHVYRRVVALPLEDLTDELDRYVATVPAPRERLIESWKKLKAYRAAIPIDADPVSAEIFFLKVEVAVAILESRLPGPIT